MKTTFTCSLLVLSFSFVAGKLYAQNMNSPYSVYGIGDIDNMPYNRTTGMGGTGLALKSGSFLINNNPAAITGIQKGFFIVTVAATGKNVTYSGTPVNEASKTNKDFWLRGISFASKVNNWYGFNFGFRQFSNVNYKYTGSKQIEGTANSYLTGYEGEGGLNDYYLTNAFSLGKHFSIGIKSSIIAGGINLSETLTDGGSGTSIISKQQDYFGNARFEFGSIYSARLSKGWDFSLGGKFINKTNLPADRTLTVTDDATDIVTEKYIKTNRFYLPKSFGGGISFVHNKKTTYAADYTFENWSPLNLKGTNWNLINSNRFSAGVEFSNLVKMYNQTVEKKFFQVGAFVNNSYLQLHNQVINEYGITAGMGGYMKNLLYSIAAEAGQRGTTNFKLIKENYFKVTLTLSYRDFFYSGGKKYD